MQLNIGKQGVLACIIVSFAHLAQDIPFFGEYAIIVVLEVARSMHIHLFKQVGNAERAHVASWGPDMLVGIAVVDGLAYDVKVAEV